jgi:hypothetical protein
MKYYPRLQDSELHALEKDFVDFLVVNGITADDWVKIKDNDLEKAEALISEFSNVVYESSLRKADYLLMVDEKVVRCFNCLETRVVMASLKYEGTKAFDFHKVDDLASLLNDKTIKFSSNIANKLYEKKREHEMFDMILSGCKIADEKVFQLISLFWQQSKVVDN